MKLTKPLSTSKIASRPWTVLGLSLLSFGTMCYVLFSFPPGASFSILSFQIPYLPVFFLLLFLTLYGLVAFFLTSALQGIAVAGVVIGFLLFRVYNLTNPFFTILLVILFLCIEGVLWKRK